MSDESTPAQPPAESTAPSSDLPVWTPDQVREVLRGVFDPELHMNIVDLGLVYNVRVAGERAEVDMTLTSPGCPYGPYLIHQVKDTVQSLKGISDAKVTVVWDPPWGPDKMSEEVRLELGFDL
ncbi:MAG TPA: metal-sulfur cluster assembly factor [Kiritimatiellia bacterium]|nr:metal-sulfur cluster assembly factor [Kiritimatiellia bacterium]